MLKSVYRAIAGPLHAVGIDPLKFLSLRFLPKYLSDRASFVKAGGKITAIYPIFDEFKELAGSASGHYFHQDLLVASFIYRASPIRHIDVGSRIDGFVAHVASFRTIEIIDVRPLQNLGPHRIKFVQGDLMTLSDDQLGICDSLSCLHALEHFGLGRYGDPIDPMGHIKGFGNLYKMLKPNGLLYISFPIGRPGVHFNAHRVFGPMEIVEWAKDKFEIVRFDYVDDVGDLHLEQALPPPDLGYGCGIYTLKKH